MKGLLCVLYEGLIACQGQEVDLYYLLFILLFSFSFLFYFFLFGGWEGGRVVYYYYYFESMGLLVGLGP